MTTDHQMSGVLAALFRRRGGPGERTRLFADFDEASKGTMVNASPISEPEEPVIACFLAPDEWFLITTRRVVRTQGGQTDWLAVEDLKAVTADLETEMRLGRSHKKDWTQLRLTNKDGGVLGLTCEAGNPFVAVWNVLGYLAEKRTLPESS